MRHPIYLSLMIILCACSNAEPAGPPERTAEPYILETYQVPAHAAREIQNSLSYLLSGSTEGQVMGRATLLGADQIAVAAPARMHAGIERLIDRGAESSADATPRLRFNYWLVKATPSAESSVSANLAPIEPALVQIAAKVGPLNFTRLDFAENVLLSGANAQVSGAFLQGNVHAVARGDRIAADVGLFVSQGNGRAQTEIEMTDGETIVLALISGDNRERDAEGAGPQGFLAFAIRAELF